MKIKYMYGAGDGWRHDEFEMENEDATDQEISEAVVAVEKLAWAWSKEKKSCHMEKEEKSDE